MPTRHWFYQGPISFTPFTHLRTQYTG